MGLLLSDKEISRIEGYALVDIKPGEHLHSRIMRDIAKAQLKKVVEELEDDYVFEHDVEKWDASGRVCKEGCRGCAIWQALPKEIQD